MQLKLIKRKLPNSGKKIDGQLAPAASNGTSGRSLVFFAAAEFGFFVLLYKFRPNPLPVVGKHFFARNGSAGGLLNRSPVLVRNRPDTINPTNNVRGMHADRFCQFGLASALFIKVFTKFHVAILAYG